MKKSQALILIITDMLITLSELKIFNSTITIFVQAAQINIESATLTKKQRNRKSSKNYL